MPAIERWQLLKSRRTARCVQMPHPLGVELRVLLGADDLRRNDAFRAPAAADTAAAERRLRLGADDLRRREVFGAPAAAATAASEWREAFEQKGWRAAPPRFTRGVLERALAATRGAQARVPGDNAMGHVLSYRLKVMCEALEVALDPRLSLDDAARERRVVE